LRLKTEKLWIFSVEIKKKLKINSRAQTQSAISLEKLAPREADPALS
jgi:hypothetical protein